MVERTPKILIVDDDPRLRDLLRRYLGENGFNVLVSENGEAMKRLWVREHFDVLILDLMMPGEDGLAILKRLRAEKDMTPVIMLTARGEDVDRILGLSSALTIISANLLILANCLPASTPYCAAVRVRTHRAPLQWKMKW